MDFPALQCRLDAFTPSERSRHRELRCGLDEAFRDMRPLPDGYAFDIDARGFSAVEFAEWMLLERRCCPFLRFQLDFEPGRDYYTFALRGPHGVRELIEAEFSV